MNELAWDSLVAAQGYGERYWVGPFEDGITELGIRAALWDVEENDGGNRADLMLEEWAERGYPGMAVPMSGMQVTTNAGQHVHTLSTVTPACSCLPAEISGEEFAAARALLIERFGVVPPSLQKVIDLGGRFAGPIRHGGDCP